MSGSLQTAAKLDDNEILKRGVIRASVPSSLDCDFWATSLSRVTPLNATTEDGEYAFYRNILDDPEFPFSEIFSEESEIGRAILSYFDLFSLEDIRLDDAFCVHYNTSQVDTTCAKHVDPSDITVNICLEKSPDCEGNQVVFYGSQRLHGVEDECSNDNVTDENSEVFLVEQEQGYATIHYGHHPHMTLGLTRGQRTNVVLTYCYKDERKSDVKSRTCYAIQ